MNPPIRWQDLPRPHYNGSNILNLMASIIKSRGGRTPHRALAGLPPAALRPYRKIVLLLLDGLGANQLHQFILRGEGRRFLALHPWQKLTTACPATTAAVVTTLATGASPMRVPVEGLEPDAAHVFRTYADYEKLAAGCPKGGEVLIYGAGLVAVELAEKGL